MPLSLLPTLLRFEFASPRARLIGRRTLSAATILVTIWAGLVMGRKLGPGADSAEIAGYWHGETSRAAAADYVVASSPGEWDSLWSRIGRPPPTPFPDGRSTAVGILLGTRSEPGHGAHVISAATRGDKLVVVFEETRSTAAAVRSQEPEAPWTVMLLKDRPRAVSLEQRITR